MITWLCFMASAIVMFAIVGVGLYLSDRGVFKAAEDAAKDAVAKDVQNIVDKVTK